MAVEAEMRQNPHLLKILTELKEVDKGDVVEVIFFI